MTHRPPPALLSKFSRCSMVLMGSKGWLGAELAGYRIDALLGRGGMGVVYRATHLRLGRQAALKLLPESLAADADYRRRFEREAQLAASLDHPHIIPIYDADYVQGVLYLAMRYVDGVDLGLVIEQEHPMGVDRVGELLGAVADALDTAHNAGLIHRDVKPANVLVAPAPRPTQPEHVYLCDFGIAKNAEAVGEPLTSAGQILGTLQYCAPEQIQGDSIDGRVDQYALGCVAFHCLTGQVPFPRAEPGALMYAHLAAPIPRVSTHRADLAAQVDDVFAQVLAKQPDERFPDCTTFIHALRTAGRVAPVPTPAVPVPAASDTVVGSFPDPLINVSPDPSPGADSAAADGAEADGAEANGAEADSAETVLRVGPAHGQAPAPDVEALYDEALAAFWTERWEQAIELLQHVLTHRPDHSDAVLKLAQARQQQQLAPQHAQIPADTGPEERVTSVRVEPPLAHQGAQLESHSRTGLRLLDAGKWRQAIAVLKRQDSTYRDSATLLGQARREFADSAALLVDSSAVSGHPSVVQILRHSNAVNAVAFSPDGCSLATASFDKTARVWDTTSGAELLSVTHTGWFHETYGVAFSPDGRRLATASSDKTARVWDATSGVELRSMTHNDSVVGVAFSPDGRRLATACRDKTGRIWDVTSGRRLATVTHNDWVMGVAFSPDGGRLATASIDGTARVWDAGSGQRLATVTHHDWVLGVVFSPDGRRLATARIDGTAWVWDVGSGQRLATVTHNDSVRKVAFCPSGRRLATASSDNTARIWDATTGEQLTAVTHQGRVLGVAFSPDGRRLATASEDLTARIWALTDE